jgi:hypothetical protein
MLLSPVCGLPLSMLHHKHRWIRRGEILHPAEYKNQFFGGKLEHALVNNDALTAASPRLPKRE